MLRRALGAPTVTDERPLPRFDRPPVNEVVFSVQYQPIAGLTPAHLGLWWEADDRRDRYPVCEVHPPVPPVREEFEERQGPSFTVNFAPEPPPLATWFATKDRSELVQIQQDRFTRNWTRGASTVNYPSYDHLRPRFEKDFDSFCSFLSSQGFHHPIVTQCELTYINPIPPGPGIWSRRGEVARVLAPWTEEYTEGFLSEPEDMQIAARYLIEQDDAPIGRLLMSFQSALDPAGQPVLLLQLAARGRPLGGEDVSAAMAFVDLGHEWIVRGFATLTTKAMHEQWGRRH
jgi:uncharacterized protein (TIGR04255 family)